MKITDLFIPPQYRIAAKLITALLSITAYTIWIWHTATTLENKSWKTKQLIKDNYYQGVISAAIRAAQEETAKSQSFATFIDEQYNAKINEIHNANNHIAALTSDIGRLRQRTLCIKNNPGRMPENSPVDNHQAPAAETNTGFAPELNRFLDYHADRDDENIEWIKSAVKEANELCKRPNVICN